MPKQDRSYRALAQLVRRNPVRNAEPARRAGIADQIERRSLLLLNDQTESGTWASALVVVLTLLIAPNLHSGGWLVAIALLRAASLGFHIFNTQRLRAQIASGNQQRKAIRRVVIGSGLATFLWGALTWPLDISSGLDLMSFQIITISLFSICLLTVSSGYYRPALIAALTGGALGLAPKVAQLALHFGPMLVVSCVAFLGTVFAFARQVGRQSYGGILLDMRRQRTSQRLERANAALEEALARATWLADRDDLTQLRNRRAFESEVAPFLDRFVHRRFALLLLDIDHFKQINDRFGHETGDGVLMAVGTALRQWERDGTGRITGRWGGEEFIALVAIRGSERARDFAEDLRQRVEALGEQLHWPDTVCLTTSIGCAPLAKANEFDAALQRADQALYEAKHAGRNRCKLAA